MYNTIMTGDFMMFVRAVNFAAEKHRDQRRKDASATPYINHPVSVAAVLAHDAGVTDANVLAAAILHDTVEDTNTSLAELKEVFGSTVAGIVGEVTDNKSLPKAVRKQLQIESAARLSHAAKLVKLADKISNLRDIAVNPPVSWSIARCVAYFAWAHAVVTALGDVHPRLEYIFGKVYDDGIETLRLALEADLADNQQKSRSWH